MGADEDRWDDSEGYETGVHEPFRVPGISSSTHAEASAAVAQAIADYHRQRWYQTAWARMRFALFWAGYKPRLMLAFWLVSLVCWVWKKSDRRIVSQKVWMRLGV